MKQFFVVIVCIPFVLWMIAACSAQAPDTSQINSLQTEVAQLKDENQQLKDTVAQQISEQNALAQLQITPTIEITPTVQSSPTAQILSTVKPDKKIKQIRLGQTITIAENCEFTLEQVQFSKKIIPTNPASFYQYYEAKEPGTTFVDIVVRYKNLESTAKVADRFGSAKVIYNEKYEYPSMSIIERENHSDFTYSNITSINPLSIGFIHYLANVPEEVETGRSPVLITLTINGEAFQYRIK